MSDERRETEAASRHIDTASLDGLLNLFVDERRVPGIVALVLDRDSVLYEGAAGMAGPERPMTVKTVFEIKSLTKIVTSVAIMKLWEEGRIDLDEPAASYLPLLEGREVLDEWQNEGFTTRPPERDLTVRHLLTHTAGFGYRFSNEDWLLVADRSGLPHTELPMIHDPGDRWTYGLATRFLGRMVPRITGQTLDEYLATTFFEPLGLADIGFELPPDGRERLVNRYDRIDGRLEPQAIDFNVIVEGDGGMVSTARDFGRFIQMLLRGGELDGRRFLEEDTVRKMGDNQIGDLVLVEQKTTQPFRSDSFPPGAGRDTFGYGFQIRRGEEQGRRRPGSLSWAGMYNTHFWIDPAAGLAVVLFMQFHPFFDGEAVRLIEETEAILYQD